MTLLRGQQISEVESRQSQHDATPLDVRHRSPYLTSREAVTYLRLNSLSALYKHIQQNRLPSLRRGRTRLFDVRDLDAWLRNELQLVPSKRTRRA